MSSLFPCPGCAREFDPMDLPWTCPACGLRDPHWNLFSNCPACRFNPDETTDLQCPHCGTRIKAFSLLFG